MISKHFRLPFVAIAVLFVAALASFVHVAPAHAAGETYTWKDYRTITVSGGDLKAPVDFLIVDGAKLTGDQDAMYRGSIAYGPDNCRIDFVIYTYKTTGQGYTWAPAGPIPVPPEITNPGTLISCNAKFNNYNDQLKYHDKWVNIQGTRPTNPNAPERPEQQTFRVYVLAPDPQSTAPKTDTVYIYSGDGKTRLKTLTAPFVSDAGQANWPPDQTPMALHVDFQNLDPGNYIACDTYVAKNCTNPGKLTAGQKFTKVKYDGTGSTTLGTQFVTPDKKRIRGHVEYHLKAPCGSAVTVNPVTIELTGPDGKKYDQITNAQTVNPGGNETGQLCTKDIAAGLYAQWENMPPGVYQACTAGAECISFTKPPDQGVTDFTLVVSADLAAPADQKVCTSGDGIAGALAWIICPAVEIIAKATDFFENNIIIPFMTVSPLTTNNNNPIYLLWQDFRDLANVGFVVLLFVAIFSIALSKYGLMRMLPRLLVVAIGINVSYFVAAFLIDISNIFGSGVSQFIMAALHQAGTTQLNNGTSAGPVRSIFTLGGAALLTVLLTGGSALGWLFGFIGLAALVLGIAILVMILRQLAVITLVVISPVIILLYLLPNTQGTGKKGVKTFGELMLMFPMFVLLFGSGKIFAVILQQPDFKIGGNGVTDEVGQSVRVIMQFVAYVAPLAFFPATFAASSGLMGRAYGAFHKRAVQPRAKKLGEDAALMRGEAKMRMARSGVPGLSQLAGSSQRRDYVRAQRRQNLERTQQQYLAGAASNSAWLRSRAAGVSGQAGQTRASAFAANTAERARTDDINAEQALLNQEMRRIGMDEDTFAERVALYLENPAIASNRVITGSNGQTFDIGANEGRLQRAMLNSAASQGYVRAIEAARMSSNVDQNMLDDIIRRNDAPLKSKGGYHLATNFSLAAGRMQVHDPTTGTLRAPASQHEMEAEIKAQRLVAMANSGADSVAKMKASLISDSGDMLAAPGALRTDVLKIMDHISTEATAKAKSSTPINYRQMLHDKMDTILDPKSKNTLALADASPQDFQNIMNGVL